MATALSTAADILWVDPPISPLTRSRFRHDAAPALIPRLTSINDAIHRLSPRTVPLHTRGPLRRLTAFLLRLQIRRALKRLDRSPAVIVASHLDDVLTGWEPDVTKVFFGTDDFVAAASLAGTSQRALESDERRQLQVAQIVIAISESLAHRWRRLGFAGPLFTIPNGVCAEHYAANSGAAAPPVGLPRPIAGFVGHLSSRIDIGLLESVVDAGCSLLLIGPLDPRWEPARFKRLLENSRVLWKGPMDFDRLPGFLQTIDVGLTPYTDSAFNQSSFPLKTLEYLATGKPALSTDLPSVRWLNTDLITIAKPEDFGRVALEISRMDGTDIASKRKAFAMNHSWSRRAMSFADAIGIRMPQGRASAAD